jgi:flagellar assembly protein FliH
MSAIEIFEYPSSPAGDESPVWSGYGEDEGEVSPASAAPLNQHREWEQRLAEETRKAFERGREGGRAEAREVERQDQANARQREEQRLAGAIAGFSEARDGYLNAVESEVVKLALAVAARILRRESQMDPLLLTGAVRVALGQLSAATEVRMRVPAGDLDLWREVIVHLPNLAVKPEVLASDQMRLGDCVVECSLGKVDLGIRSQLGEIERGFFDRAGGDGQSEATKDLPALLEAR